jgi:2,4-dienoyl-CoA reductase-like NADH-dependent reductase (Old Yellow Enzyme family)
MQPNLFSPLTMKSVTFRNRIGMSPMCTYSAQDGMASDWHLAHLVSRAQGGAGLILVEATAVSPEGRISPGDLGLWDGLQGSALAPITRAIKEEGAVPGIQIAHAGRKAGTAKPWEGGKPLHLSGWPILGPSPIAFDPSYPTPSAMTVAAIKEIVTRFGTSAALAREAGFTLLEIHGAHGYLIHSFLSPLSNQRQDEYGGPLENRMRILTEIVAVCQSRWGRDLPLGVRLSMSDWAPRGLTLADTLQVTQVLRELGVDFVDCSSGGTVPHAQIPGNQPLYQVPFAKAVKQTVLGIRSMAVGMIQTPAEANQIIQEGSADMVLLGRALLRDPYWALRAARELGDTQLVPKQYRRAF